MEQKIAHVRDLDKSTQSLYDHLLGTSRLARQFAAKIGLADIGQMMGLLHDMGKASMEFQQYILSNTGQINPDEDGYIDAEQKKGKIDHSSAGAQYIFQILGSRTTEGKITAQALALCLASHHSGLIDCISPDGENTFSRRMEKNDDLTHLSEVLPSFLNVLGAKIDDLVSKKIEKQLVEKMQALLERGECNEFLDSQDTATFKHGLLVRYLFSCLIDADRLDTADFEMPKNLALRNYGQYQPWQTLIDRLDHHLTGFKNKKNKNHVDKIRQEVSQACLDFSRKARGVYQLNVPTGGGKTLSSLRFALNHAAFHKLEHVFYIVPFTSIIDQNADEVRKILEDRDEKGQFLDKVVLEHHSNLTPEEESRRHNLLAQNWDAPIVFTTQIQFLEALFGHGTRGARRLHQLANSVIIFDEVQTIPVRCVHLFNLALRFLVHSCGSTVVLCTATQPLLDKVEPVTRSLPIKSGCRIIQNEKEIYKQLKRVEVFDQRKIRGWSEQEITELANQEVKESGNVLIVVNTKDHARRLYQALKSDQNATLYHLSTNMCPAHRLDTLEKIKAKLKEKAPIICVSTQLIEAGVDIDFGCVIRYMAGLDSIVQASGRCNRHGQRSTGNVHVINPIHENIDRLKDIRTGIRITERIWDEYQKDPARFGRDRIGLQAMNAYYQYYFYDRKQEMSYHIGRQSPAGREDNLFNLLSVNTNSAEAYQRITGAALSVPFRQAFQTAAKSFKAIDQIGYGVVVPFRDEGVQLINDLCAAYHIEEQFKLLKKAQRYSVNLYPHEFEEMVKEEAVREVQKEAGVFYLEDRYYCEEFGWSKESVHGMKTQIH